MGEHHWGAAMKLLNPGPVSLTKRVRDALSRTDLCHREPECTQLTKSVADKLLHLYPGIADAWSAVIISGSGTAAVEAMAGSLVPRSGRALVVANGVYGERIAAMLEAQGKLFDVFATDWETAISLAALETRLKASAYTAALVVHHETTSARLNDLRAISAVCRQFKVPVLVDAVSSFGAEAIDLQGWDIDACAATANKCLHGAPGIAFVIAKTARLSGDSAATSVYLDLLRLYREQQKGSTAFTPAVHVLVALEEALLELEQSGGIAARREHYLALSQLLRQGFKRLGFRPLLTDESYASFFTSFLLPDGLTYAELHDRLKQNGFVVYAGQGKFLHDVVRISTMGDLAAADIQRLIAVTEQICTDISNAKTC
jgi:2-aminoethylphosphonate-pyruvate transaminase